MSSWAHSLRRSLPLSKAGIVAICLACLSGCIRDFLSLDDLVFTSAKVIDQSNIPGSSISSSAFTPPGKILDIEFTSRRGTDLYSYAENSSYNMGDDASICSNGKYDASKSLSRWPYVYGDKGQVRMESNPVIGDATRSRAFHVYLDLSFDGKCSGGPGDLCVPFAYDLQKKPEYICFCLDGGASYWNAFRSNQIVVPKAAVAEAVRHAPP